MIHQGNGCFLRPTMLLLLLGTSAGAVAADPDCWCRAPDGNRRDLGTVECVNITGKEYLMRCEMSTNTPFWRRVKNSEGCPVA